MQEPDAGIHTCCEHLICLFAEISLLGEKYLDQQIENAVNGVKEMKAVMQKSSEDHKKLLDALEKTKEQKEVETCLIVLI